MRVSLFVEKLFAIGKQMIKLTRLVEQLIADRSVSTGGGQTPYFNLADEVISYAPNDEEKRDLVRNNNILSQLNDMYPDICTKGLVSPESGLIQFGLIYFPITGYISVLILAQWRHLVIRKFLLVF